MTEEYEIWTDPLGRPARLVPVGRPDDGDEPWFAEGPGQLPPYEYRVEAVHNPRLALREVVLPLAPWTAYDAIFDRLVARGWNPPPATEEATCEHGLSASLCGGPMHWYD
jgi:hypothetical protein